MVTDSITSALLWVWNWLVTNLPAPDVPSWFTQAGTGLASLGTALGSVSSWLPVGLLTAILATWALAWAAGAGIKIIRIVASFFTMGGGSAA